MLFYTTVTGFVDIYGLVPALGALLLWLSPGKPGGGGDYVRAFAVGFLLAATVLLRRWYAFYAVSFFIAALIDCMVFMRTFKAFVTAAATFAFTLLFLFQPFVAGLLFKTYASLYSAFSFDLRVDIRYVFYYFGLIVLAGLSAGFVYLLTRRNTRRQAVFLILQPVTCFVLFVRVQSHGQQHLLLYIPALVLTAVLVFSQLLERINACRLRAAVLAVCVVFPSVNPLLLKTRPATLTDIKTAELLPSFIYVPPVREDADSIVGLVRYLDTNVGARGKTVGILASSLKLNIDMLLNAENSLNLPRTSEVNRRYLVWLPEIDSRDAFPGSLFDCDYILVADAVQAQLGPDRQRCVILPAEQLLSGVGIGVAYRPVGNTFQIDGGAIRVRLYEKVRDLTITEKQDFLAVYNHE
jgi:hypothetical protein